MTQPEDFSPAKENSKSLWLRSVLIAGIATILTIVLVYPFSQSGRQWSELFNLAHAPSFFAALTVVAGLLDPSSIGLPKSWYKILPMNMVRFGILFSLLLVIGALCEMMQGFVGRSSSVSDLLANLSGLSAGLFWCLGRKRSHQAGRFGLSLIAAGLLTVPSWSPIVELYECYLQRQEFPLLASFERSRELHNWYAHEAAIERSTAWATHGSTSMQVLGLAGTKYPGANLCEPVACWHEFTALELDLFNPGDIPLTLSITIFDELHVSSGYAAADRFARTVEVPPGMHLPVRVELADVRSAPVTRLMDMSRIASLNLFVVRPGTDFVLLVDNVRLTNPDE